MLGCACPECFRVTREKLFLSPNKFNQGSYFQSWWLLLTLDYFQHAFSLIQKHSPFDSVWQKKQKHSWFNSCFLLTNLSHMNEILIFTTKSWVIVCLIEEVCCLHQLLFFPFAWIWLEGDLKEVGLLLGYEGWIFVSKFALFCSDLETVDGSGLFPDCFWCPFTMSIYSCAFLTGWWCLVFLNTFLALLGLITPLQFLLLHCLLSLCSNARLALLKCWKNLRIGNHILCLYHI